MGKKLRKAQARLELRRLDFETTQKRIASDPRTIKNPASYKRPGSLKK